MLNYKITYRIDKDPYRITCLVCNMTSYNLNDIARLFCAKCDQFHNIQTAQEEVSQGPACKMCDAEGCTGRCIASTPW
jgi:hypothetical protein